MSMDRREALGILGALVPTTATLVAGCPAGEPPDIARGETADGLVRHELTVDARDAFRREFRQHADGRSVFALEMARGAFAVTAMWPDSIVPTIEWAPQSWRLRADWTADDGPWIGRVLRSDRGCVEELAGNEWRPVGRLAGEP